MVPAGLIIALASGCKDTTHGAAPTPDAAERVTAAPSERAPSSPPPQDDPAKRICGGDGECHRFFALYSEFSPLAGRLLERASTGEYGTAELVLAARAKELSREMQRLACVRKSPIRDMCADLKNIAREMSVVHAATQRAYSNLVRRSFSDCKKTQREYARGVERGSVNADENWDLFRTTCEDYFSVVVAPGAPKAAERSESIRLANSIADIFLSDMEKCGQERTRAAVTRCANQSLARICEETRLFAGEHGWDTVRWLAGNAELLPREWPQGAAVKTTLNRCRP